MEEDYLTINPKLRTARNFSLSKETDERLRRYMITEYGNSYMLSATIEKAIKEFLDRRDKKDENNGSN